MMDVLWIIVYPIPSWRKRVLDARNWYWNDFPNPKSKVPIEVCVREALIVAMEGINPPMSQEEFESLYKDVLESERYGCGKTGEIISKFEARRRHG